MAAMRVLLALLLCMVFYSDATALPQHGGGLEAAGSSRVKRQITRGCATGDQGACCGPRDCPSWAPVCSENGYCQLPSYRLPVSVQNGCSIGPSIGAFDAIRFCWKWSGQWLIHSKA